MILTVPHDTELFPTLGPQVCDFMEQNLVRGPGDLRGLPVVLDAEEMGLIYRLYEVFPRRHPLAGRRRFKRAGISLAKGLRKTEIAALVAACELHQEAPVRCTGWTPGGEPIGGPVTDPYIPMVAYTEEQSEDLAFGALRVIIEQGPLKHDFIVNLDSVHRKRGDGKAVPLASAPDSRDGARTTFQHCDEALALDTPIPTPTGWTTMGALEPGDLLFGQDGSPCRVIGKSEVHVDRPCYRVLFTDGTSIVADAGHLWYSHRRGGCGHGQGCRCPLVPGWKVRKTSEMLETRFKSGARDAFAYHVPFAAPLSMPAADLPIDPYLLGVWLGDGDERNATVSGAEADLCEISAEFVGAGYKVSRCKGRESTGLAYVTTADSRLGVRGDSVVGRIRSLGLLKNKHIPAVYLRASFDQRLALLQGLMDSDGHVTANGFCTFVNTIPALVDGVVELLRTLGQTPRVKWRNDTRSDRYRAVAKVGFQATAEVTPFRLKRKAQRVRSRSAMGRAIVSVEPVDSVPVQCIAVDSPDRLFIAGSGFVPTHNTHRFTSPRLVRAHQTMLANIPKRKIADAWTLETTTAPEPGAGSVAEGVWEFARQVDQGLVKDASLFFFHRQAGDEHDLTTSEGVRAAVIEASGPAAAWRDIDAIVGLWADPTTDRTYFERVYCNRLVRSSTQAFDVKRWDALTRAESPVKPGRVIVIGFDGAQFHDSTGIVCTDVETGYQWVEGLWECPPNQPKNAENPWQVPVEEVDAVVQHLFETYSVWRMYADPPYWQSWVATWRGRHGDEHVIEWWTNRTTKMAAALEGYETAQRDGLLCHSGDLRYRRHIGNARKQDLPQRDEQGKQLYVIRKDRPDSPFKIDLAMAGCLSWEARTDAIAAGALSPEPEYQMLFVGPSGRAAAATAHPMVSGISGGRA